MKTAISIKDTLFQRAENFARKSKMSRSQLFSEAVKEYLEKREKEEITKNLNEVYAEEDSSVDPTVLKMALLSLPEDEW
jgi:metal-responsive CopG/Arc/MetJ family transcriptional regulator